MNRGKYTKILFGLLTLLVIVLAITEIRSVMDATNVMSNEPETANTIEIGPYTLPVTESKFLNSLYDNINNNLEGSNNEIIGSVAQAFVADFFTLRDKSNFDDVGGLGFVFQPVRNQFRDNAIASYYLDLYQFRSAFGQENLPLVTEVTVGDIENLNLTSVSINDSDTITVHAVKEANVTWTYEDNDVVDTTNIINQARIRFVQDQETRHWFVYSINQPQFNQWW